MNKRLILSLVMFLQFCIYGATLPIFSLFWKDHVGLSGQQIGIIFSLSSISGILSPFITTFIADKFIRSKYIAAFLNFLAGICLITLRFQKDFLNILVIYTLYATIVGPIIGLLNAISFHLLSEERSKFGNIRVWGTIGYMFSGTFFSLVYLSLPGKGGKIGNSFIMAGIFAFIQTFVVLLLPSYKMEKPASVKEVFPSDAFKLLLKYEVLIILLLQLLVFIADRFYFIGTAPYLHFIGVGEKFIMPIMSLGQLTEIFAMFLLGILIPRIGYKKVFLLGVLSEIIRFGTYLVGHPYVITIFGVAIHGFTYAFLYVTISIFLDEQANTKTRTALHQLFYMITFGFGGIIGNIFAGKIMDIFTLSNGRINYKLLWFVPLLISLFILIISIFYFPVKKELEIKNAN